MQIIAEQNANISKLQSYPVLGKISEYYFYLDLEFNDVNEYETIMEELKSVSSELTELGVYNKASVYDHQAIS